MRYRQPALKPLLIDTVIKVSALTLALALANGVNAQTGGNLKANHVPKATGIAPVQGFQHLRVQPQAKASETHDTRSHTRRRTERKKGK